MSYPRQSLRESHCFAEIQSVYSTTPAGWFNRTFVGACLIPMQIFTRCILQFQPTVPQHTHCVGVLPFYRNAVGLFNSPSRLNHRTLIFADAISVFCSPTQIKKKQLEEVLYCNNHHPHVVQLARISLTLSHHFSLSFIASGTSSGLHPVSSHSCWIYVLAGRPAFVRPM